MKAFKLFAVIASLLALMVVPASAMITFDEFPVGTAINSQYAPQGVLFSGGPLSGFADPVLWTDGGLSVLSPYPPYNGDFYMHFITPVDCVEFDAGYWDVLNTAVINVYDPLGGLIASTTNQYTWATVPGGTGFDYEHFSFTGLGLIGDVYFSSYADPAGGAMDNLDFCPVPEPGTLMLLGSGLLGLGFFRRKK